LSIYPGTHDFTDAEAAGWLDRRVYFERPFQELKVPFDADEECTRLMNEWFRGHSGLQRVYQPTLAELEAVAARLDGHPAALVERTAQPALPGPLPANWADWSAPLRPIDAPSDVARVGSTKPLGDRKRLKVV